MFVVVSSLIFQSSSFYGQLFPSYRPLQKSAPSNPMMTLNSTRSTAPHIYATSVPKSQIPLLSCYPDHVQNTCRDQGFFAAIVIVFYLMRNVFVFLLFCQIFILYGRFIVNPSTRLPINEYLILSILFCPATSHVQATGQL